MVHNSTAHLTILKVVRSVGQLVIGLVVKIALQRSKLGHPTRYLGKKLTALPRMYAINRASQTGWPRLPTANNRPL